MNLLIILLMLIQSTMAVTSSAFEDGKKIPDEYTCQGKDVSPPLTISNLPDKTVSMVLIMDDPDAPGGGIVHWLMYNIATGTSIKQDDTPGVLGANGNGDLKYLGPCPTSGIHHYHFKIYALDVKLDAIPNADKARVIEKMEGHILATGELIGFYTKDNNPLENK